MRAATAFFAGAGTVVVAIAAGIGGGLVLGDIMSPQQPNRSSEVTRLEQRMSSQPIPAATGATQPVPPVAPDQDAFARARDADLRRDERRAEDKRKYERRKWSDKRKWRQRGDDDLREVEAAVREDSERRVLGRNEAFFGRDDDRFERREQRPMFGGGPGSGRSFSLFDD